MTSKLTFGSIFSGGGLVEAGIADLFDLAFAVEHDGAIADVYRANFGDHVRVAAAQDVNVATLPPVDCLWASPPCQSHSVARSKRLAERDDAEVGIVVLDYVKATNPRYVFIENVEGYARHDVFRRIVDGLFRLGYWVRFDVLNAADHGVPQTRRRLILRAIKDSMIPMLPAPTPWQGWYSAIEDLIPTLPESRFAKWQLDRFPEDIRDSFISSRTEMRQDTRRLGDEPMFTIKAQDRYPRAFIVDGKPANFAGALQVLDGDEPVNTVTASQTRHPLRAWLEQGRVVSMTSRALGCFQSLPRSYRLPEARKRRDLPLATSLADMTAAQRAAATEAEWCDNALATKVIGNGVASQFARAIITATVEEFQS